MNHNKLPSPRIQDTKGVENMDANRRKLVISASLLPLAGSAVAASGRVNGQGLEVVHPLFLLQMPDAIFRSSSDLRFIVPSASPATQACLNSGTLSVSLMEEIREYTRTVLLTLPSPTASKTYNVASLPAGSVMVVVYDATRNLHHEYIFNSGTIKLTSYDTVAKSVVMSFDTVKGYPTGLAQAPNNSALKEIRIDGSVRASFTEENAGWLS